MAKLNRLIEPHALAVLSFTWPFFGIVVTPLDIESGGFHIYQYFNRWQKHNYKGSLLSVWGEPKDDVEVMAYYGNALENDAELPQ